MLIFAHKGKSNKYALAVSSWTGALHNDEPKLNELSHRYDKYIHRKLQITTLKRIIQIENKNFHYVIRKDAFLSKGTSNEEMASHFLLPSKIA